MKKLSTFILIIFLCGVVTAGTKTIDKHFAVKPSQKIILNDFSAAKVTVKSWDKNDVYINVSVKFLSSDKNFEKDYLKSAKISSEENESSLTINYEETDEEPGGWSFLGIKFSFNSYQKKYISGEIYVPAKNALQCNLKYGEIFLENMKGEVELPGTNNNIKIRDCSNLKTIDNDYGKTYIENSGGNLTLSTKNSDVNINNFNGSVNIDADYSNLNIDAVSQKLRINSTNGTHRISDIHNDLYINSDYSNIKIENVNGFAEVIDKNGSIDISKVDGISVNSDYSRIYISSVSGKAGKDIIVNSTNGNLKLENASGNVKVNNPYSDMDFKNIKGNLDISGQNGTIMADQITGNWESNTAYSSLKLYGVTGKIIKMENKNGDIRLDLKSVPSNILIRNDYGGVTVNIPKGYNGDVDLSAEYGSIECDLPVKMKNLGSSAYAMGKIGSGSGSISIETKSANIILSQKK